MAKFKPLPFPLASEPAPFTYSEAVAMQAFAQSRADEEQQRIAWKWILESACGLPVWGYRESQRETDIALGRHFVGQQLIGITKVAVSKLKQTEDRNG